jgi:hypothetical protein
MPSSQILQNRKGKCAIGPSGETITPTCEEDDNYVVCFPFYVLLLVVGEIE